MSTPHLSGMRGFLLIWVGQLVSLMGTNMTTFALSIWVWQQTNTATALTLVGISTSIPSIITSFFAGPLVDRWDRKRTMIIGDFIAVLTTGALLFLYTSESLQVWHLYVVTAITGVTNTFQHLAYSTSLSILLPKEQYTRASGMNSLAEYGAKIGAPIFAGILLGIIGVQGIMFIDILTFLVAVCGLLLVHIPRPTPQTTEDKKDAPFIHQALYGFHYIFARPSLTGLLAIAFSFSLAESLGYPLIVPMILARTDSNQIILGTVQGFLGVGGVIGAVLVSIWGGPKRRIHAVLLGLALTGLLGDALMGIGQNIIVWIIAALFLEIFIPLTLGAYHSIWQSKVPPDAQGRVFAARWMLSQLANPVSMLVAGLAADKLLEPAFMPGGALVQPLGWLVGTGAGAGMGLILVICGVGSAIAGLSGYLIYAVRNIENILPDHDTLPVT